MFEQNFGSQGSRWLKWFMLAMVLYAITTFWPKNRTLETIGVLGAGIGISIVRDQIIKRRSGR
jgi:hypothetical protein